jgi:hypothetical protein
VKVSKLTSWNMDHGPDRRVLVLAAECEGWVLEEAILGEVAGHERLHRF